MDYPVYSLALQSDGKVLLGSEFHNFGLTRVNADGSPDTNFNENAFSAIASSEPYYPVRITALILQPDGKVIYPGDVMLRLNSNGTLDSSFTAELPGFVYSMALQTDGKVILGGNFNYPGNISAYGIARLNSDGSLVCLWRGSLRRGRQKF